MTTGPAMRPRTAGWGRGDVIVGPGEHSLDLGQPQAEHLAAFADRYPALLSKRLLTRHYSSATLASSQARAGGPGRISPRSPGRTPPGSIATRDDHLNPGRPAGSQLSTADQLASATERLFSAANKRHPEPPEGAQIEP